MFPLSVPILIYSEVSWGHTKLGQKPDAARRTDLKGNLQQMSDFNLFMACVLLSVSNKGRILLSKEDGIFLLIPSHCKSPPFLYAIHKSPLIQPAQIKFQEVQGTAEEEM